jgi:hypothetical protein
LKAIDEASVRNLISKQSARGMPGSAQLLDRSEELLTQLADSHFKNKFSEVQELLAQ